MATPKPVPSRAALNALRGLVFTTSCSVILLAEERRRRTKIARAAIDNARKLHTVKSMRRPQAMLDSRVSESDLDLLSAAQRADMPVRRKRRTAPDKNAASDRDKNLTGAATRDDATSARLPTTSHATISRDDDPIKTLQYILGPRLSDLLAATIEKPHNATPAPARLAAELLQPKTRQELEAEITTATSKVLDAINSGDAAEQDSVAVMVYEYLQTPDDTDTGGTRAYTAALPSLRRIVEELGSPEISPARATVYQELGLEVARKVVAQKPRLVGSSQARALRRHCLSLMKSIIQHQPSQMEAAMDIVLSLYKNNNQLLSPILQWLADMNNVEDTRRMLQYISTLNTSEVDSGCSWILELLESHLNHFKSISDARQFYEFLRKAEIHKFATVTPQDVDYRIHSRLLHEARLHHGIHELLQEMKDVNEIDASRAETDPGLAGPRLIIDAFSGSVSADHAFELLQTIETTSPDLFTSLLSNLVDVWSKRLPAQEFEEVLRTYVERHSEQTKNREHSLKLKNRWMYPIIEHHSKCSDHEALLSWLHFSFQHGFQLNGDFLGQFYHLCQTRLWVDGQGMVSLYDAVRAKEPRLPAPRAIMNVKANKTQTSEKAPLNESEDWETLYIRSSRNLRPDGISGDEKDFDIMQANAFQSNWARVWVSYQTGQASWTRPSLRCLRLAIMARLKLDDGSTEQTASLVEEMRKKDMDVNEVLTPLLLAQIAEGHDAMEVINGALQRGLTVHDMVYNRAARHLAQYGLQDHALKTCQLAAAQNGNGDPLYSLHNFTNLVRIYTSMESYKELSQLLADFTARHHWWAGKWMCMQSLKFSMKLVAKRAAIATTKRDMERHKAILAKLDLAFQHGFTTKPCPEERKTLADGLVNVCNTYETRPPQTQKSSRKAQQASKDHQSWGESRQQQQQTTSMRYETKKSSKIMQAEKVVLL